MKEKKSLLVAISDGNHLEAAKQLFSSAYFEGGWDEDMMLLAHQEPGKEIPERDLKEFRKKGIVVRPCRQIPEKIIGKFDHKVMFDTLYLFRPEFKKWKNIVYLDTDMIVTSSIDRLKEVRGFSAVPSKSLLSDQFLSWNKVKGNKCKESLYDELNQKCDLRKEAFNAGMFVFNTQDIIKEDTFKDMLQILEKYKGIFTIRDQNLHNLFFYDKWKRLPYVYNNYTGCLIGWTENDLKNGIILHFIGEDKPWKKPNELHHIWILNIIRFKRIKEENPGTIRRWGTLKISAKSFKIKLVISIYRKIAKNDSSKKNLKKIMSSKKKMMRLTSKEIYNFLRYGTPKKKIKKLFYLLKKTPKFFVTDIPKVMYEKFINKNLGRMGRFMKKRTPTLYNYIKR